MAMPSAARQETACTGQKQRPRAQIPHFVARETYGLTLPGFIYCLIKNYRLAVLCKI